MNKIAKILTFNLVLLCCIPASNAQQIQKMEDIPSIEVTGMYEMEVVPDEIYIKLTLREKYENKLKITIDVLEEKLKSALKNAGIDVAHFSLSNAFSEYERARFATKDVMAEQDYTLKVSSAAMARKAFICFDQQSVPYAYIDYVNHSKIDSLKQVVKVKAIQAAKDKVNYMLLAIGEKAGRPLIVKEIQKNDDVKLNPWAHSNGQKYYALSSLDKNSNDESETKFEKIKIATEVFVKFEIK